MKRRIVYTALVELVPAERNPKRHDLDRLRASIERFGVIDPVVQDGRTGRLISGHGRTETLAAAEAAGLQPPDGVTVVRGRWHVPVVVGWSSADDAEANAALVAVNRLTETGGWDVPELVELLDGLDFAGIGYEPADLDAMLASLAPPPAPVPPAYGEHTPRAVKAHTKPGDLWQLGRHVLVCGDSRDPETWGTLLESRKATLVITSPPYAEQRDYDGSTEFEPIAPADYVAWFAPLRELLPFHMADDGSWVVNIKEAARDGERLRYVLDLVVDHLDNGWRFVDEYVWPRPAFPLDPHNAWRFKNGWEPVWHFTRNAGHKWRPDAVRVESEHAFTYDAANYLGTRDAGTTGFLGVGRDQSTKGPGLAYPSNVLPSFGVAATGTDHPAAYPIGLPAWFISCLTDEGDVVVDPFGGSGSTLLAAEQLGRVGAAIELSPKYCDMACARWQDVTGVKPVRNGRRVSF